VALVNKEKYQLNNVQLLQSDWFKSLPLYHFDLIVSNPPYIKENDPHLITDIQYEPRKALTSGKDGLNAIRIIISQAKEYLKPNGFLLLEHGYNQGNSVRELLKNASFNSVASIKDYALIERLSIGKKPS
jgi:release factor glutamine methyltransferase